MVMRKDYQYEINCIRTYNTVKMGEDWMWQWQNQLIFCCGKLGRIQETGKEKEERN